VTASTTALHRRAGNRHRYHLAREGVSLNIIQRQLGHANLGTTSIYLQGIDPEEIITAVRTRRAPMMSASAGLRL
jgi:integrase